MEPPPHPQRGRHRSPVEVGVIVVLVVIVAVGFCIEFFLGWFFLIGAAIVIAGLIDPG
jgi:hypothetical protein